MRSSSTKSAMSAASRYWKLVTIDAAGKRRIEEIAAVKEFFLTSFPEFLPQSEVPNTSIQRQLLHWMRGTDQEIRLLAERCLVCFISSQIERVCQQLEAQFGTEHGFTCSDLLMFVLVDEGRQRSRKGNRVSTSYQSLSHEILQSFDPDQSSLATWTTRRVKHHKELNAFLLEHGVYLVSDWAILNDTNSKQLQRIFSQFYQLTTGEIQKALHLLESYHSVYRTQRMQQRQAGIKGQCPPPSTEQLEQMRERLFTQTNQRLHPEALMAKLQEMATRLRQYRIYARGGALPTESIDAMAMATSADRIRCLNVVDQQEPADEQTEFLNAYRKQFLNCLDQAIEQITEEMVKKLGRKDVQKAQKFLTALQLFHCQGRSMTDIARLVNLQAQFHVSRLLKLKSFRADIQQQLLVLLRDRVIDQAKSYTADPKRLYTLNQQIEAALAEQITTVMQEAAMEASTATITKNQLINSLFAQRLCRYLDNRRTL